MISSATSHTIQFTVRRTPVSARGRVAWCFSSSSSLASLSFSHRGISSVLVPSPMSDATEKSSRTVHRYQSHTSTIRSMSSALTIEKEAYGHQPMGDLFESKLKQGAIGENLVGKTARIRRVFGPSANAEGLLICGGGELARHASFDPDYESARAWIRSRPIGPAVLSPILISGLVGALVEAALPQTVPMSFSMNQVRPLIVGVEVCARVRVESVKETQRAGTVASESKSTPANNVDGGYEIFLSTEVVREHDDAVIAEGTHRVWIPSYLTM